MKHTWINKPKFEKMSWANFWYYYKFHVIFGIFAAIVIGMFIWSMCTKEKIDLYIHFVGTPPVHQNAVEDGLQHYIAPALNDIHDNDEVLVVPITKNFASGFKIIQHEEGEVMDELDIETTNEADVSVIDSVMLDITVGEPALYISNDTFLKLRMEEGVFTALDTLNMDYTAKDEVKGISERDPGKEHVFAISVEGNTLLEKCNVDTTDKYIAVRVVLNDQKGKEEYEGMYENAILALKHILKYNPK
ncbi:MAG: hypothetical protein IJE10_01320 [Clostridia bacterium]|nr:hypothetical protein [Clostridia bacterium]